MYHCCGEFREVCHWCREFREECRWCREFSEVCHWCGEFREVYHWCREFREVSHWYREFREVCHWCRESPEVIAGVRTKIGISMQKISIVPIESAGKDEVIRTPLRKLDRCILPYPSNLGSTLTKKKIIKKM